MDNLRTKRSGERSRSLECQGALALRFSEASGDTLRPGLKGWPAARSPAGLDKAQGGGEGGILCQGPEDLENRCEISVSRQPRWVVCTANMYRNRWLNSSGNERMVNAFPPVRQLAERIGHQERVVD